MIVGGDGKDTITGGSGSDMIFAGHGGVSSPAALARI